MAMKERRGFLRGLIAAGVAPAIVASGNVVFTRRALAQATGRTFFTSPPNLYVAPPPLGNDANDGLSLATPKATIQAAYLTLISTIDCGGFNAQINLLDGTYTKGLFAHQVIVGGEWISLCGYNSNASSVTIIADPSDGFCVETREGGCIVVVQFMTLQSSGPGQFGLNASQFSTMDYGGLYFGDFTGGSHVVCNTATLNQLSGCSINGNANVHLNVSSAGYLACPGHNDYVSGGLSIGTFLAVSDGSGFAGGLGFVGPGSGTATAGVPYNITGLSRAYLNNQRLPGNGAKYTDGTCKIANDAN